MLHSAIPITPEEVNGKIINLIKKKFNIKSLI